MRCLFIHLKFRHWPLDGSTFIAQAPQFSWTTQFHNGYCTVCVCVWTQEERWNLEILEHLHYSPDLAPSDFHLFPNMKKKHLHAKRFKSHDDVKPEVQTWLRGQDPTFYRQGFENWISRLDKRLQQRR